jgi:hypothetical protein
MSAARSGAVSGVAGVVALLWHHVVSRCIDHGRRSVPGMTVAHGPTQAAPSPIPRSTSSSAGPSAVQEPHVGQVDDQSLRTARNDP